MFLWEWELAAWLSLAVRHHGYWLTAKQQASTPTKHSEQPHIEPANINKPTKHKPNTADSFITTAYTPDVQLG
jgi:hypothetical protein